MAAVKGATLAPLAVDKGRLLILFAVTDAFLHDAVVSELKTWRRIELFRLYWADLKQLQRVMGICRCEVVRPFFSLTSTDPLKRVSFVPELVYTAHDMR
jgi:hypothetical protein